MIQINYRDSRPIYEQVMDGFRRLIISQVLKPDEKLPSVREIARDLAINPNTIQRAYRELETEGYIYTISGKGCFVAEQENNNRARISELFADFDKAVEELIFLGVSRDDIHSHLNTISVNSRELPQI